MEKNQLITQLSAKEEEIRHITTRLEISEQSRAIFTSIGDSENDKIKLLLQERKMLESRLEEAHLHLYDIKRSETSIFFCFRCLINNILS
jgi:golgin subfamily A member 1